MPHGKKNILFRLLFAMCLVSQAVIIMPHHHHGSSDICINVMHCMAGFGGEHAHGTHHDHDNGGHCRMANISAAALGTQQKSVKVTPVQQNDTTFFALYCDDCVEAHRRAAGIITVRCNPIREPICKTYISRAFPVRAPSITC